MLLGFIIGMYCGIGVSAGIWYYIADDPFRTDIPRPIRTLESVIVGVRWLPILGGTIFPMIAKELFRDGLNRMRSLKND